MSTTVIDKNEARVPFFGDKMSFVTGLDPLGLQNPSVKAYSHLLPGLNNVTGQIRCYSFYCWLLNEYAKKIKSTDPKEQKKFVRKAEYIIALISLTADIPGISGRQYAGKQMDKYDEFDLNKGIYNPDGSTINTYWQYGFGVFGQYYVGSMRQIGIIDEPTNDKGETLGIYRKTPSKEELPVSGEALADSFDLNVAESSKQLFLECIDKASVNKEELKLLTSDFNLRKVILNSKEWNLLLHMLLSNDAPALMTEEPSSMRRQTLYHLLDFTNRNPELISDREFTMYAYSVKGVFENENNECLTGWYYYQLNEYWQVACTAIFNGSLTRLEQLKGPGWLPLQTLIESCCELIIDFLNSSDETSIENKLKPQTISINLTERELYNLIIRGSDIEKMSYGFLLIFKVFVENKNKFEFLYDYAKNHELNSSYDALSFMEGFGEIEETNIDSFIKGFLNNNIINRHQIVAYRKMGGGTQSTQKFIIENELIRQIGNFGPGFTGPRIGNLITYLKDLHLITENNQLSDIGKEILQNQVP